MDTVLFGRQHVNVARITNDNALSLYSAAGGATPAAFGELSPSDWQPTKPGPQPRNAGITPGYRRPKPDDGDGVTRGELRKLRRSFRRKLRALEARAASAILAAGKAVRRA